MPEQRNIVILGGSVAGIGAAHYTLKHILPSLQAKRDASYHVYLVSPSSDFFFRIASPRGLVNPSAMGPEKLFYPIVDAFKQYSSNDFTFVQATATGLDTSARVVSIQRHGSKETNTFRYHSLIIATGSRTPLAAHSIHTDSEESRRVLAQLNKAMSTPPKDVIIAGGGPTGVETAGEVGEYLNGKPGWFSTPTPKAKITLITSGNQLLSALRPAIGAQAEKQLKKLGVDVVYNRRIVSAETTGGAQTTVRLDKGDTLQTDLYLATMGDIPNTTWVPPFLLDEHNKVRTNSKTLRVDVAGPRVYCLGDASSASRNTSLEIDSMMPVVMINMKRDLLAYSSQDQDKKPAGADKEFEPLMKEMMIVPIGSGGGVGAVMGWKVPSWFVWLLKSRDYFVGMAQAFVDGKRVEKEFKWAAGV